MIKAFLREFSAKKDSAALYILTHKYHADDGDDDDQNKDKKHTEKKKEDNSPEAQYKKLLAEEIASGYILWEIASEKISERS